MEETTTETIETPTRVFLAEEKLHIMYNHLLMIIMMVMVNYFHLEIVFNSVIITI